MQKIIEIEILWGGYYSSKQEDGTYSLIRILDFNKDAYHFSIFQETFEKPPLLNQAVELKPFIQHVPQGIAAFFHKDDLQFLGGELLTSEDLSGYCVYLEAHAMPEEQQIDLTENLIRYSQEKPLNIRLELENDEVIVSIID